LGQADFYFFTFLDKSRSPTKKRLKDFCPVLSFGYWRSSYL